MIKTVCERCGKECTTHIDLYCKKIDWFERKRQSYDLCRDCKTEFFHMVEDFMKEKNHQKGVKQ